jgi:transposase
MRAYSNDLRRRVIERIQENEESQAAIAEHFSVSISFVEKLWHRFLATGKFEAKPHTGGRERLLKDYEELIRAEVKAKSDITLAELIEKVAANGEAKKVGITTMHDELRRLRLPRKKNGLRRGA